MHFQYSVRMDSHRLFTLEKKHSPSHSFKWGKCVYAAKTSITVDSAKATRRHVEEFVGCGSTFSGTQDDITQQGAALANHLVRTPHFSFLPPGGCGWRTLKKKTHPFSAFQKELN